MKIGIIADVHGDYHALRTAVDRLDQYHQVDRILCAGDLVGRGPYPGEVVDLIRRRNIPTVRGNHDDWATGLSPENKGYVQNLPLEWQDDYAGRTIFMTHGKPGNNIWGLYRDHLSDTLLNMMLVSLEADVLIVGHTHVPMFIQVERGCVINPGSLYTFKNLRVTSHTYGVLRLPDMAFELFDVMAEPVKRVAL